MFIGGYMEILKDIPFEYSLRELLKTLHLEAESEDARDFEKLLSSAVKVAAPKVIYDILYVKAREEDSVDFGKAVFTSSVLSKNLEKVERVFPYIITCGAELGQVKVPVGDFLQEFWLDAIKEAALFSARKYFKDFISRRFGIKKSSNMSPGSGAADIWPIEQQKELFSVFGDVEKLIGVRLTESCLMLPNKTVSGLLYPTEVDFATCRLCPRDVCKNRTAPYDEKLAKEYGR